MDISLTIIMTDDTRSRDLIAENTSCMLLEVEDEIFLINCGGTPSALRENISKIGVDLSRVSNIIITSPLSRYYSSIRSLPGVLPGNVNIHLPSCTWSYRIARALSSLVRTHLVRDHTQIGNVKLLNVTFSPTYSEIVLEVGDNLLISTPGVALTRSLSEMLTLFLRFGNVVAGVPVPVVSLEFPKLVRLIRRAATRSTIFLTHLTPPETERILSLELGLRRTYVGDTIKICC